MSLPIWNKAYPMLSWRAQYKTIKEDFVVTEALSFDVNKDHHDHRNQVEHLYLFVEKSGLTSYQLIELLMDYFEVENNAIGYAGLKDKNAITQQWFSIYLPGKYQRIDIEMLLGSTLVTAVNGHRYQGQCRILDARWHSGKLRRGAIASNKFRIKLRSKIKPPQAVFERLALIKNQGFPNYFGKQRFGIEAHNLKLIEEWIKNQVVPEPRLQSLLFSTARSFLFNHILNQRIAADNWNKAISGDYFMLDGTRTSFQAISIDQKINHRCEQGDIHPCASLWGEGELKIMEQAGVIEAEVFKQFQSWCNLLNENQLQISFRAMRCLVQNLTWEKLNATDLQLDFALPSGSYATAFLNEIGEIAEYKRS